MGPELGMIAYASGNGLLAVVAATIIPNLVFLAIMCSFIDNYPLPSLHRCFNYVVAGLFGTGIGVLTSRPGDHVPLGEIFMGMVVAALVAIVLETLRGGIKKSDPKPPQRVLAVCDDGDSLKGKWPNSMVTIIVGVRNLAPGCIEGILTDGTCRLFRLDEFDMAIVATNHVQGPVSTNQILQHFVEHKLTCAQVAVA
jgi:hypothetical protein